MNFLIKNGEVFDGSGAPAVCADLRVRDGLIEEIGVDLPTRGEEEIDASGLLVMPGLVDLHVHVFSGVGIWSIDPFEAGLRTGVTTLLDAGSAGSLTYPAFHQHVIERAPESIFALVNISMEGCLLGHSSVTPTMGELCDARLINVEAAVQAVRDYPERIIGAKARLSAVLADGREENERAALRGAVKVAEETGTFCMFHHAASTLSVSEVVSTMRAGDVYTHLYHPEADRPFSQADGRPEEALLEGRERGVLFDVGHGAGAFLWEVAEAACQQYGFWPDIISTDIHQFNLHGPVWDMPTTMSKFLHLGWPLEKVIQASTSTPARAMRMEEEIGLLKVGRRAEIAILERLDGAFNLRDVRGTQRKVSCRLAPKMVIKGGEKYSGFDALARASL
ncbi:MAG: amidohydrolase family protein [Chthoniobacterales bacterium]